MPFIVLLALLLAPYGRMEARAAVQHAPTAGMTMAGHCDPAAPAERAPAHRGSIDCLIACAGMAMAEAAIGVPLLPPIAELVAPPITALRGILPQFDPPPPRALS